MISQPSLQSDNRLLAVPSRQTDWRRMCWWALLTRLFNVKPAFRSERQQSGLDFTGKKKIKNNPKHKTEKPSLYSKISNSFPFMQISFPFLWRQFIVIATITRQQVKMWHFNEWQHHSRTEHIGPSRSSSCMKETSSCRVITSFPGLWAPAGQIPDRDVC